MSAPVLRDYQIDAVRQINHAWDNGARVVLYVLATGGGKTVIFAKTIEDFDGVSLAIAHRQELVGQISCALAQRGIRHRIISPPKVIRSVVQMHMDEFGRSYYDPGSRQAVAGVDTILARKSDLSAWLSTVGYWVMDEGHHMLQDNKWGKAADLMPRARGLLVTAEPERADGRGLARAADGYVDKMVLGPCGRELIERGHLVDYSIYAPTSDMDVSNVPIGATGDFVQPRLRAAVRDSSIVGDVVKHYLRIAPGKKGITFATDRDTANEMAEEYRGAGVQAHSINHKTPDRLRIELVKRFRHGDLMQLVNVDLFGEGFDVPGVEVVSGARPTESFNILKQHFGRMLRLKPGKTRGIYIDHASNIARLSARYGLPDDHREYSLLSREKRSSTDPNVIPVKNCPNCTQPYRRIFKECPYCGFYAPPAARSGPEFVDGDLHELDATALAELRKNIATIDKPVEDYRTELAGRRVPLVGQLANCKRLGARQLAQTSLRHEIAMWAGYQRALGRPDSESYRRFYFRFGTDVLTAQALGVEDAAELETRVREAVVI